MPPIPSNGRVFGTLFRFVVKLNFVMICYGHNGANPGLLRLKLPGIITVSILDCDITAQAKLIYFKNLKNILLRTLTAIRSKMKKD